jgi:uncharacterized membrane protein
MLGAEGTIWFLVAAYLLVAAGALTASWKSGTKREQFFWAAISVALLMLGVAKLLQLQGRFTDWLRTSARDHHLYAERAVGQYLFVAVVVAAGLLFAGRLRCWMRSSAKGLTAAAIAMFVLLAFILIRAASIHVLDPPMTKQIGGLRSGWWVELAGLFVIAAGAGAFLRGRRR